MQDESTHAAPAADSESVAEVRTEIQEYLDVNRQRRMVFPRVALVGIGAGALAVVFRMALAGADNLRNGVISWAHQFPAWGWIFPMLFSAVGAVLSVMLVRRMAPEASGSGIPHLKAVLHRFRELDWRRVLPVKFIGGVLAIGSGMALGREGPTVQMGGAVGDAIARWLKAPPRQRQTLIAAGAGAGLAAAFNAPLSGLVFVLEEVQRDFRPIMFGGAFIAAAMADLVARLASGQLPVFDIPSYPDPSPLTALPIFVLLGIAAGLLGIVFNRGLIQALNIFSRIPPRWALAAAAAVGAGVGLVGWFSPMALGGGHNLAEIILHGQIALTAIPLWFLLRFVMSNLSYATGAPGGIFAPLLVLGALIGLAVGLIAQLIVPGLVPDASVFALVGMAAYFAAIVRAPLTGAVLIIEMTGSYAQMLPLLVSCFAAYAVAELLGDLPVYEALLERDLLRSGAHIHLQEPMITEFVIEPGAPYEGREIRSLGLPPGCIIVRCADGGREWVPTAASRLEAFMRVTAVIAPEAVAGLAMLRKGCESEDH